MNSAAIKIMSRRSQLKTNSPSRLGAKAQLVGLIAALPLLAASQSPVTAATLTTDKPDYSPGQHVTFTGIGWQAGETVAIDIYETSVNPLYWEGEITTIADASGNISNSDLLVQESFLGQGFTADATGQSSHLSATTSFTDSPSGFPTVALPNGTAPVNPPSGGFGIDGDLQANTNSGSALLNSIGDWMAGPTGTGGNVLDSSGNPISSSLTFHLIDGANCASGSACDDVFTGANAKFNADPSLWSWKMGSANGSSDINHALIHISKDGNGHIWAVVAADRGSANGDSAIDFEFLQKTLTVTTNGAGGGFTSDGLNGGRTTNDFILSLTFTGGGTVPSLALLRWLETPAASGTFDYVASSTNEMNNLISANSLFGAVNTVVIPVAYGAFGATSYQVNTFGEVAVDLTALLTSFNPCLTMGVKTIFVKTRNSQSASSSIVDFVTPAQILVPLTIGPAANAGPDQTKCEDASGATTFVMAGSAQAGSNPLTSTNWTPVAGYADISDPHSLTPTVTVYGGPTNVTLRLTVTDAGSCGNNFETNDVVLTVAATTPCALTGDTAVFAGSTGNSYAGPVGLPSYSWSITGNADVSINGSTTSQTINVDVAPSATGTFTVNLSTTSSAGCIQNCSQLVTIQSGGCVISGPSIVCAGSTGNHFSLTAQPANVTSYTWSISDNSSGASLNPTPASSDSAVSVDAGTTGSFTVHVTISYDNGASISCGLPVTVEQVTLGLAKTDTTCTGTANGTITATFGGGVAPYSVSVDGGAPAVATSPDLIGGLTPGSHNISVTDAHNCSAAGSITVGQAVAITASENTNPDSCNGASDGSVTVTISGGAAPYSVTVNGVTHTGVTSSTMFSGLASGTYPASITDANGCPGSAAGVLVDQPAKITASEVTAPAGCNGGNDGTVTVSVSGGTAPYSVTLNGATHTGVTSSTMFSGLASGTYAATITDAHSCSGSAAGVLVDQPTAITASEITSPASCHGGSDGSVTVSVSGGTAPYAVTVNGVTHHGVTSSTMFSGLASGTYAATITDAHSCSGSAAGVLVDQPTAITASETTTPASCNGNNDGSVTVNVSGGTAPYSVAVNGVVHTGVTTSTTFTGLASGTYPATIADAHSCSRLAAGVLVDQPSKISASESTTPVSCNGGNDGSVTVNVSGGTAPYAVTVNGVTHNGVTTSTTFNGLASGTYAATIADAHSCSGSATGVLVNQPSAISASEGTSPASCHGATDGTVTVSVSGGTAPYSVKVNGVTHTGVTTSTTFTGLAGGTYPASITDANSCTATAVGVLVDQPTAIVASERTSPASCDGSSDGSVTVNVSGGTGPYAVTLNGVTHNGVSTSTTFTGLAAGTYPASVTDARSCHGSAAGAAVGQPTAVSCQITGASDVRVGSSGNTFTATGSGGTAPYTFNWSVDKPSNWVITGTTANPGASSTVTFDAPNFNDSAIFTVTVTDASGCPQSTCKVFVTSLPLSYVTDSSLCTFVSPFRLILSQDPMSPPCYKVTSSNPGQYYYNMTYLAPPGTPAGTPVTFKVTIPYPFVTQGAQPVHAYDGVTLYPGADQLCFSPGAAIFADSKQVTLNSYTGNTVGVTTTTITETVLLPADGFIYLNIHLDYGLKKCGGYSPDTKDNAVSCSATVVPIPNNVTYPFGYTIGNGSTVNAFPSIQSWNDFNKMPGAAQRGPHANSPNYVQ